MFPSHRHLRSEREYGALDRSQYAQFVRFFRQASPYVEGHRGRTFVVSLSRPSFSREESLQGALFDVALLHGLGVRVVLVIDGEASPGRPQPLDAEGLERAVLAAGLARLEVEGHLSRGLAVSLVRRHAMPGGAGGGGGGWGAGEGDAEAGAGAWWGAEGGDEGGAGLGAAGGGDAVVGGARWAGDLAELADELEDEASDRMDRSSGREEGVGAGAEEGGAPARAAPAATRTAPRPAAHARSSTALWSAASPFGLRGSSHGAESQEAHGESRGESGGDAGPGAGAGAGAGTGAGTEAESIAASSEAPGSRDAAVPRHRPPRPLPTLSLDPSTDDLAFPSGRGPWSAPGPPQGPGAHLPRARREEAQVGGGGGGGTLSPHGVSSSSLASRASPDASSSSSLASRALRRSPPPSPRPRRRSMRLPPSPSPSFSPSVPVVTGNYVVARRRGVVGGVDLGLRGAVRVVQAGAIRRQLDSGALVLLTPIGFSAAGEALRCDPLAVAARAAADLGADKLVLLDDLRALALETRCPDGKLPDWLALPAAERLVAGAVGRRSGKEAERQIRAELGIEEEEETKEEKSEKDEKDEGKDGSTRGGLAASFPDASTLPPALPPTLPPTLPPAPSSTPSSTPHSSPRSPPSAPSSVPSAPSAPSSPSAALPPELERWREAGAPAALLAASLACRAGVRRAHVVDASMEGALLLELYTRGGSGCMVSADLHEGLRPATPADVPGLKALLAPLEARGYLVPRDEATLERQIDTFRLLQVGSRVMGCAALVDLGTAEDGTHAAELAAFAVHPELRGRGKGDAILEVIESEARQRGVDRLVLLTTRTADWFGARGFLPGGDAAGNPKLPPKRRARVDPKRKSKLFYKALGDDERE